MPKTQTHMNTGKHTHTPAPNTSYLSKEQQSSPSITDGYWDQNIQLLKATEWGQWLCVRTHFPRLQGHILDIRLWGFPVEETEWMVATGWPLLSAGRWASTASNTRLELPLVDRMSRNNRNTRYIGHTLSSLLPVNIYKHVHVVHMCVFI